ncbi:MAG: hypothetical protein KA152_01580 [Verrucomicrobiales bacterium]|nr:hypothetical protein [Verrucomicrobiales bacterium]
MKTTIDLPEDVLTKAKIVAATRRTTLRELVLQGLKLMTETPPEVERKEREAAMKELLREMRASNTEPMTPLKREEIYER